MSGHEGVTGSAASLIEVGELLARLDRGDGPLLLDVRNDEEFQRWRLEARAPVETVHLPYFDFVEDPEGSIARLPRGREVVVLCAHGGSSEWVAELLVEAGFRSASVRGGMVEYGSYLEAVPVPLQPREAARFSLFQVNRRGKGCLSYVIVSGADAVVVDPSRQVEWYEAFVRERGARIVQVLDTHVHADHVSGGPRLAHRSGAPYFVCSGDGEELRQPVVPLADGSSLRLGGERGVLLQVRVLRTPGHTPGSTCYLLDGRYLLSGDTLFVSGVGRPDLGGHVDEWGRALFETLRSRLASLPPETVILPAHYGGVEEIGQDAVVRGTLGELRRSVPELRIETADAFVEAVRRGMTEPPDAYAHIIRVNLGEPSDPERAPEWELGRNQCAASMKRTGAA